MPVQLRQSDDLVVRPDVRDALPTVLRRPLPFLRSSEDHHAPRGVTSARLLLAVDLTCVGLAIGASRGRLLHGVVFGIFVLIVNAVTGLNRSRLTFVLFDDVAPLFVNG